MNKWVFFIFFATNIYSSPKGKCVEVCQNTHDYCKKIGEEKLLDLVKRSNFRSFADLEKRNPQMFAATKSQFKIIKEVCMDSYESCRERCKKVFSKLEPKVIRETISKK